MENKIFRCFSREHYISRAENGVSEEERGTAGEGCFFRVTEVVEAVKPMPMLTYALTPGLTPVRRTGVATASLTAKLPENLSPAFGLATPALLAA